MTTDQKTTATTLLVVAVVNGWVAQFFLMVLTVALLKGGAA